MENKTITNLKTNGITYSIGLNSEIFDEAMSNYLKKHTPNLISLKCYNCGASINQKIDDYILKCPYCNSAYLIGIN